MTLDARIDAALLAAERLGASDCEVCIERDASLRIEVHGGEVETLALADSQGVGIRIFTPDQRMGFAHSSRQDHDIHALVDEAWNTALANSPDEFGGLIDSDAVSDDDWSEEDFEARPADDKIALVLALEKAAKGAHAEVDSVQEARYSDSWADVTLANSRGLRRRFRSAGCSCVVEVKAARDGVDAESGWEFDYQRTFDALRPEWVAAEASRKAVEKLGGAPCDTERLPLVLNRGVTAQFLGILASALSGVSVLKGKSLLADKLGEAVAAECITLVDQNDLPEGLSRAPFDGEGTAAQRTVPIEAGVLRGYLHNQYSARRMGAASTANARRGGYASTPELGPSNLHILPGSATREALMQQAGEGFLVTSAMGVHTANPISGDFSFGASGFRIRGGAQAEPVRGVTIAGNVLDLFKGIQAVGSDIRFYGTTGAPSLLTGAFMVSGN